ncbi:MAG: serine hydrolase [Solirubrobacterales bacterium]|nr:serine hydrolase [Solirubrobacterales bacterium]
MSRPLTFPRDPSNSSRRASSGIRVAFLILAAALLVAIAGTAPARADAPGDAAGAESKACGQGQIARSGGCTSVRRAAGHVVTLARRAMRENGLRAVILRVDVGERNLVTTALGHSMVGVPATERMHFRIGSMAIPYLTTLLLQLRDEGRLRLDDKLADWFPELPEADRITLRMLANNTSGYRDYIQGNPAFAETLYANVFRQWKPAELLATALDRGPACEPGACFNYAHTNFILLSKVLREVTGRPVAKLMQKRIFAPLGLRDTDISPRPDIPAPVLHAYTSDRGVYEDSTFWSPSWTIGSGTIMTSDIDDVAESARAIGTGKLLSRRSRREQFAPSTAGLSGLTSELYYGLGVLVTGSWRFQNPMLNGYTGVMAYLPAEKLSIAVTATNGEAASLADKSASELLFTEIGGYLAPDHPATLPG